MMCRSTHRRTVPRRSTTSCWTTATVVRAAIRDLDMSKYVPFKDWTDYPIMAALSCRGCTQSCVICGGSAAAFKKMHGREKPAFRDPDLLAADVRRISRMSSGPVFILGDLRQPGREYSRRFFDAMKGFEGPIITELFSPASRSSGRLGSGHAELHP